MKACTKDISIYTQPGSFHIPTLIYTYKNPVAVKDSELIDSKIISKYFWLFSLRIIVFYYIYFRMKKDPETTQVDDNALF